MTPALSELLETARVVSIPLAVGFRGITHREAVLFEGPSGWSEFSPFVEYDDIEAATWLAAAIEFGWRDLPELLTNAVPVNATVPSIDPAGVTQLLARFPGCTTAKVKVAASDKTLKEEVELVAEVRRILGPEGRIRLDANGGWNVDEAEHAVHAFAPSDVEYLEQPCATIDELAELKSRIAYMDIPIAADESIRKSDDPHTIIRADAADILVLKTQPLGGVQAIIHLASSTKKPVVISSALETSIGISQGVAAACALGNTDYAHGLATAALLAGDITSNPLAAQDGQIQFRRIIPETELLSRWQANPERTEWWLNRLQRCYQFLEA